MMAAKEKLSFDFSLDIAAVLTVAPDFDLKPTPCSSSLAAGRARRRRKNKNARRNVRRAVPTMLPTIAPARVPLLVPLAEAWEKVSESAVCVPEVGLVVVEACLVDSDFGVVVGVVVGGGVASAVSVDDSASVDGRPLRVVVIVVSPADT